MDLATTSFVINAVFYALLVLNAASGVMAALRFVHRLQLESYQGRMYLKGVIRHFRREWLPLILLSVMSVCLEASAAFLYSSLSLTSIGFFICTSAIRLLIVLMQLWLFADWRRAKAKKSLRYTPRLKRMLVMLALVYAALQGLSPLFAPWDTSIFAYLFSRSAFVWGALFMPLWVFLAYALMYPFETLNNRRYFNMAKRIMLERADLRKIAITGSFGKTSMKMILGTLLREKYNVLVPEGSINTPMGLTRVIREELKSEHEVFIAEMGARYRGDIQELCALVRPNTAVLTAVGEQHLETFGSLDNIIKEKFSLVEALEPGSSAFFNADNDITRALYDATQQERRYLYGMESASALLAMRAESVLCTPEGSAFTLCCGEERTDVKTSLLGKHNIVNITGAAAVAKHLGLSMEEIARGIQKLEPVPHRLQLIQGAVTVIDDAFNSNPEGAKGALEVLKMFDGRKIVVTPGMVELGEKEAPLNKVFGAQLAEAADIVILVGEKRTKPIAEGLKEAGFDEKNVIVTPSLAQATEQMSKLTQAGDVVLFENDLPDNYNE